MNSTATQQYAPRTTFDRIRHTVCFETFALLITIPGASLVTGNEIGQVGVLVVAMAIFAMLYNWLYNVVFDKVLLYFGLSLANRPPRLRTIHAVCFELFFMVLTFPMIMWWLSLNFWQTLSMNIGFALFYMVYAYVYNWCYDKVFPYKIQNA